MSLVTRRRIYSLAIVTAVWSLPVVPAFAQDEEQASDTADAVEIVEIEESADVGEVEEIEEIVVVSPPPGSRRRVDEEYEDPVKARILKEYYRMQELEEEYEWRTSGTDDSSRIKWGYDPRDEYRMRNDTGLQDLSWEKEKPATIFRVEF